MVYISFIDETTNKSHEISVYSKEMALRFIKGSPRKHRIVTGWRCDSPEDNEYLNQRC